MLRRVHAAGDFATILHRGDEVAGSIVLIHRTRDGASRALQRIADHDRGSRWLVSATDDSIANWVDRQRRYDSDLWVIELDTPDLARFIDETIG